MNTNASPFDLLKKKKNLINKSAGNVPFFVQLNFDGNGAYVILTDAASSERLNRDMNTIVTRRR